MHIHPWVASHPRHSEAERSPKVISLGTVDIAAAGFPARDFLRLSGVEGAVCLHDGGPLGRQGEGQAGGV